MASVITSRVLSYFLTNSELKPRSRVRVQSVRSGDSKGFPFDSVQMTGASLTGEEDKNGVLIDRGIREKEKTGDRVSAWNASLKCGVEKKCVKDVISSDLDVLWDDGYGNKTVKDYFEEAKDMIRPDGGPPRWFCPVDCGQPLKDSPVLLFCPGLDGVGSALILHHKALGKVFEVRCLHIPVCDRTPFEGLVTIVEETVRLEHASSPNKPIYLLGDSFGGCLVLAVAARNPEIDLVVILANPATSFERSQLQPLFPLSEAWPGGLYNAVPYLLSCIMGDPVKMASVNIEHRLPRRLQIEQLFQNLIALLPCVSDLADIVPKDTLTWKLKLLKSAASYTNSRIHAVKAEVLVLSSGNDYMLPSGDEAQRLKSSLKNCTVRYFKDNGHTLLLEDGVNLLTVIKGTGKYRLSKTMDFVTDFVPPSMVFEVRCLHIPVYDRTPFEGLVKFVEKTVRLEHASSPNKPIYLVGESFGGCLALAVAARNPQIDLVLILANPATSFNRSQLQPLFPLLEALPDELHSAVPYLLSFVMGDPVKMATVNIESKLPPRLQIEQLSNNLTAMLPSLTGLADIIPKDTLLWKLKLLKSAAAYANSRLHSVKAEVLVLSSGKDQMLPSSDESRRLKSSLKNCTVRHFKENGHTVLLEDGVNLLTVIKGTSKYRRSRRLDYVSNYVPPSMSEFKRISAEVGLLQTASSAAMFSTLDDGKIVRGLGGVPNEGPVLLVGYHMLLGLELPSLVEAFLREKNIMIRGMTHPMAFSGGLENSSAEFTMTDWMKVMGAVPVTASNIYRLLSTNSHVLLYPGGAREAFHYKGEEYKLIWPKQQEFVRMAARFGATIVPFGAVGEDDIAELVLDYNDFMKIPVVNGYIRDAARKSIKIRDESQGEVANQMFYLPGLLPKVPGRFYYLFGKPIETKGKGEMLEDKENANQLYLHIKSEVESCLAYLLKKREDDPQRSIIDRTVYRALRSPADEVPAFDP